MIKKTGQDAKDQALEWEYPRRYVDLVVETLHGDHVDCRWIYVADGRGRCRSCGNWDYSRVITQHWQFQEEVRNRMIERMGEDDQIGASAEASETSWES